MVDFVEICNVCARKAIIETAKRIITFDKVCRSYSDLNFGFLASLFWNTVLYTLIRVSPSPGASPSDVTIPFLSFLSIYLHGHSWICASAVRECGSSSSREIIFKRHM